MFVVIVVVTALWTPAALHGMEGIMWAATYLQVGALPNYCDAFLYSLNAMTTYGHAGLYL